MSSSIHPDAPHDWSALLPQVQLDVRQSNGRTNTLPISEIDFLIGSLPGCDLRAPGTEAAAVWCLLARHPNGVTLRKLSPTQNVLVNGRSVIHVELANEDRLQIGLLDILVRIIFPRAAPKAPDAEADRRELQQRIEQFRQQLLQFDQEKAAFAVEREKAVRAQNPGQNWDAERSTLLKDIDERDQLLAACDEHIKRQELALKELEIKQAAHDAERPVSPEERQAFDAKAKQYELDVVRLDRWQGTLEERERHLQKQTDDMTRQREEIRVASAEMDTQLLQMDEWRVKLADESERLAVQKREQAEQSRSLAERAATLEGQQATLSVLRSRLERMREEVRGHQLQLDAQRVEQDGRESDLSRKAQEVQQLQLDHRSEQGQYETDRQQWLERGATMEAAVRQLKEAQEKLAAKDKEVRRAAEELEQRGQELVDADGVLQGRLSQIAEAQERLDIERKALSERSVFLIEREQACETLQEQLRRRADEIASRHQEMSENLQAHQAKIAGLDTERQELEARAQEIHQALEARRIELEKRARDLERLQAQLAGVEEKYQQQLNQIAVERQALAAEHANFQLEQHAALDKLAKDRADFETMHAQAQDLLQQLPDAELRAGTAMDRLGHARTQMREHLTEIHRYVRQCQDELELVRSRLQVDLDKLQQQEQTLGRNQDEQRLAVATFRQQLIDWQGQIGELKRLLARDETRLERKQARVDERARAMEAESERLAKHAEDLDEQERDVADRRDEVDRHLVDMRDWYRHKLRDLAGIPMTPGGAPTAEPTGLADEEADIEIAANEDGETALVPTGRSILSITGPADPSDRKLGQVLRSAQLIDADSLTALLAEARRQRRSLRQVLLTSGVITLYQLALIEAGKTQGLMLGAVRIIDRVRHTAQETVYRVFDPRRGADAILRHLAEAHMTDAVRPDEFRQRFTQAMLNDPHLANTLEVFDLMGRPAVLQEWLAGLPATDWPPLTAAPGVCHRLLTQAAQGLAVAHKQGLVHGHLSDASLLLTADGVLKITGLGEPPWLIGLQLDHEPTPRHDLRALGTLVSGWCTPTGVRKGAKTKPLPEALISVLYRLAAEGDAGYRDVQELLEELHKAAADIPPNAEAWDRLLKYVREHATAATGLRQSA